MVLLHWQLCQYQSQNSNKFKKSEFKKQKRCDNFKKGHDNL